VVLLPLREIPVDSAAVEIAAEYLNQDEAIALHQALGPNHAFDGLEFFRQLFVKNKPSLIDFLPEDTIVIRDDPDSIQIELDNVFEKANERFKNKGEYPFGSPDETYIDAAEMNARLVRFISIRIAGLLKSETESINIRSTPQETFGSHIKIFADKLIEYREQGYRSIIFCDGENQKVRLGDLLGDYDIAVQLEKNRISSGFGFPDIKLWFLTDHEIFARTRPRRKARPLREPCTQQAVLLWQILGCHILHSQITIYYAVAGSSFRAVPQNHLLCLSPN